MSKFMFMSDLNWFLFDANAKYIWIDNNGVQSVTFNLRFANPIRINMSTRYGGIK